MNYLKSILSAVMIMATAIAGAANIKISGCVVDDANAPVEFATVVLLTDSVQRYGTTTDIGGCFATTIESGSYELRISFVGLQTYSKTIKASGSDIDLGRITLGRDGVVMKEVTVTASPIRREADRFIMQLEDQPITIGKNGEEILKQAPGVWISDKEISINGKSGAKIYINDREQNMSTEQLLNYLRGMNAEDVSRIIVIPRAGAEYSADSQGGIIKIYTKKMRDNGIMGFVGANSDFAEDRITYSPKGNINAKIGKFTLTAGGWLYALPRHFYKTTEATNYLDANGNTTSSLNSYSKSDWDGERYGGGNIAAIYDINAKNSVGLEAEISGSHTHENMTGESSINDLITSNLSKITSNNVGNSNGLNWNLKFNYIHRLDSVGSTMKFMASYTNDHNRGENRYESLTSTGSLSTDSISHGNSKNDYQVLNVGFDFDKALNNIWRLQAGAKYTLNDMYNYSHYAYEKGDKLIPNEYYNYDINFSENIAAAYAVACFNSKRWQIRAGVRGEYTDACGTGGLVGKNYFDLFPQANVNFLLTERGDYSISAGYDRKITRPSFWAMSPMRYQVSDFTTQVGNPFLKASYNDNFTLSVSLANKYSFTFGTDICNNGINQQMRINPNDPRYLELICVNEMDVRNFFFSTFAPIQITKWLDLNLSAFYAIRGEKIGDESSYRNIHIFNGRATVNVTLPMDFYAESTIYGQNSVNIGNLKIGSHLYWGIDLKRRFDGGRWVAAVSVHDILGKKFKIDGVDTSFTRHLTQPQYTRFGCSITYNFNSGKKFKARQVESNEDASRFAKE